MGRTTTTWTDQDVASPDRYTIDRVAGAGNVIDGEDITLTPAFGTVTDAGTAITAARMNNIEGNLDALFNGTPHYLAASGTNTYTTSTSPAFSAYVTGMQFIVTFAATNTGAATINIDSLGAKSIKKYEGTTKIALAGGELAVGVLFYDGTDFVLVAGDATAGKSVWIFDRPGTYNWIATQTGAYKAVIVGGGGSGGSYTGGGSGYAGGGGGSGYVVRKNFTTASGALHTITVGAGGAAVSGASDGNNGGSSSISGVSGGTASGGNKGIGGGSSRNGGSGSAGGGGGGTVYTSPGSGTGGTGAGGAGYSGAGLTQGGGGGGYSAAATSYIGGAGLNTSGTITDFVGSGAGGLRPYTYSFTGGGGGGGYGGQGGQGNYGGGGGGGYGNTIAPVSAATGQGYGYGAGGGGDHTASSAGVGGIVVIYKGIDPGGTFT